MIRNHCLVALALGATLALHVRSSLDREVRAGTVLAMRMSDLVDRSQAILEGRVVDTRSFRAASGGIETEYRLHVARSFLGSASESMPGATFVFRTPGGVLPDGKGMLIAGLPRLERGEDVVVFLSGESARGTRVPVGLAQGKFRVVVDAEGTKGLVCDRSGLDLVDAQGAAVHSGVARATYDYAAVAAEIEALVETRGQRSREQAAERASAGKGR